MIKRIYQKEIREVYDKDFTKDSDKWFFEVANFSEAYFNDKISKSFDDLILLAEKIPIDIIYTKKQIEVFEILRGKLIDIEKFYPEIYRHYFANLANMMREGKYYLNAFGGSFKHFEATVLDLFRQAILYHR